MTKGKLLEVWLIGVTVLAAGIGTAHALTIPPGPITGTLRICYNTKNGKPRLVNSATVCKTGESRFEFVATPREVFVPANGTATENGAALLAAAGTIVGELERPTTLRLDDGTYDIGATTLDLSGTVLEGRSADNTILTGAGSSAFSISQGGTVRTDSDVKNLTVNNTGGNTFAAGIVFVGGAGRITDVNVNCSGATNAYGITNALGDVIVRGARVATDASNESVAFVHDLGALGAQSKVHDSKLVASSLTAGQGEGIRTAAATGFRLVDSVAAGSSYYANAQVGSSDIVLRNSALSGAPNGPLTCRATTTGASFNTTTCPTEFWSVGAE